MSNVVSLSAYRNRQIRISDRAVTAVAEYLSLRQAATETKQAFVRRIVAAYLEAAAEPAPTVPAEPGATS